MLGFREIRGSPARGALGALGSLAFIWDPRFLTITSLEDHENWSCGLVRRTQMKLSFRIFNVYGPI